MRLPAMLTIIIFCLSPLTMAGSSSTKPATVPIIQISPELNRASQLIPGLVIEMKDGTVALAQKTAWPILEVEAAGPANPSEWRSGVGVGKTEQEAAENAILLQDWRVWMYSDHCHRVFVRQLTVKCVDQNLYQANAIYWQAPEIQIPEPPAPPPPPPLDQEPPLVKNRTWIKAEGKGLTKEAAEKNVGYKFKMPYGRNNPKVHAEESRWGSDGTMSRVVIWYWLEK